MKGNNRFKKFTATDERNAFQVDILGRRRRAWFGLWRTLLPTDLKLCIR